MEVEFTKFPCTWLAGVDGIALVLGLMPGIKVLSSDVMRITRKCAIVSRECPAKYFRFLAQAFPITHILPSVSSAVPQPGLISDSQDTSRS